MKTQNKVIEVAVVENEVEIAEVVYNGESDQRASDIAAAIRVATELGLIVTLASEVVVGDKNVYIVKLSDDSEVEFKSNDEKAAKYRAYRIGRDNKEGKLNVVSVTLKV